MISCRQGALLKCISESKEAMLIEKKDSKKEQKNFLTLIFTELDLRQNPSTRETEKKHPNLFLHRKDAIEHLKALGDKIVDHINIQFLLCNLGSNSARDELMRELSRVLSDNGTMEIMSYQTFADLTQKLIESHGFIGAGSVPTEEALK